MYPRLSQLGRRLQTRRGGATAVEFALVAPIFFGLIFSILEAGWIMSKITLLDRAVVNSARLIYTGQAPDQDALEQLICDEAVIISDCRQNINVELFVMDDFTTQPDTDVGCSDANNPAIQPAVHYSSGAGSDIVLMRVCLTTAVFTPGLGFGLNLAHGSNNTFELVSSIAFMNEPF